MPMWRHGRCADIRNGAVTAGNVSACSATHATFRATDRSRHSHAARWIFYSIVPIGPWADLVASVGPLVRRSGGVKTFSSPLCALSLLRRNRPCQASLD